MLNGIIAAVVPNTVPTIKRVTGNNIKSKIINGMERPILIIVFNTKWVRLFCKISFFPVKKVHTPTGTPTTTASKVDAKLI